MVGLGVTKSGLPGLIIVVRACFQILIRFGASIDCRIRVMLAKLKIGTRNRS